jgi:hypothetical protein
MFLVMREELPGVPWVPAFWTPRPVGDILVTALSAFLRRNVGLTVGENPLEGDRLVGKSLGRQISVSGRLKAGHLIEGKTNRAGWRPLTFRGAWQQKSGSALRRHLCRPEAKFRRLKVF